MRWLINFATRGRPVFFKKAIDNILATIQTEKFQILVTADLDDPTMFSEDMKQWVLSKRRGQIDMILGYSESKIDAINKNVKYAKDWDVLLNMSDDMVFVRQNWDRAMEISIRHIWGFSFDFFAHFNDGYAKDALATMSVIGRDYYKRDGYVYHPSYKSFSCDAEAYYVAIMRGRHHYFEDELFLHQHPANRPLPSDETYRRNALATEHDTKLYWERLNRFFDEPHGPGVPIPFEKHLKK